MNFAWTNDTPRLFDSATENLGLYFRGTDDQFFVAYDQTSTGIAQYPLTDKQGDLVASLAARSSDLETDKLEITVPEYYLETLRTFREG